MGKVLSGHERVVQSTSMDFPTPTWRSRKCAISSLADPGDPYHVRMRSQYMCHERGYCDDSGRCVCQDGFTGDACKTADPVSHLAWIAGVVLPPLTCLLLGLVYLRTRRQPPITFREVETSMPPRLALPPEHEFVLFLSVRSASPPVSM